MKKYAVKFNTQEVLVNDNSQAIFLCNQYSDKKYFRTTNKNAFEIKMVANDFYDCLEKAKQLFKDYFKKNASSIEVKEIKQATSSMNLSNTNKQVA